MRKESEATVKALDGVLQTFWGEILEDQTLSSSQTEKLHKAGSLIQKVKEELEAEEDVPPLVPTKCCMYCGNRNTGEGMNLFCPVKGIRVFADYVCDAFKSLLAS